MAIIVRILTPPHCHPTYLSLYAAPRDLKCCCTPFRTAQQMISRCCHRYNNSDYDTRGFVLATIHYLRRRCAYVTALAAGDTSSAAAGNTLDEPATPYRTRNIAPTRDDCAR